MSTDGQDGHENELAESYSPVAPFDDTDTPAEVDAVWRSQRRIALSYFVVFAIGTFGVGLAIVGLSWSGDNTVFGGFSPAFVLAGGALYVFFLILAVAAATLANSIEDRMMGAGPAPFGSHRE